MKKNAILGWRQHLFCLYTIVLYVCLLCIHIVVAGQVGESKVVFEAHSEALGPLLERLSKISGVNIGYPPAEVKRYKAITLIKGSRTVLETLKALLKYTGLDCKPAGTILVVYKKAETKPVKDSLINVSGRVLNDEKQPVVGVSVTVQGTQRGGVTNAEGRFFMEQVDAGALIAVKGIGYPLQEQTAAPEMLFQMAREISSLDEVQVIAYGTTTKRLNTGSVTTVSAKDLASQPVTNPLAALEGRVPGLVIEQSSGIPGSGFKVQLRGQNALDLTYSQNDPLFVIDGVPFEMGNQRVNRLVSAANNPNSVSSSSGISPLNTIPISEIESIEVLKDADATSIYGSRGANGVILITTKKGNSRTTKYTLNANAGWSRVGRITKLLDRGQYLAMRREAFANDGLTPSSKPSDAGFAPDLTLFDTTRYTDLTKLLIGNTAKKYDVNFSVSGGVANTNFSIGANYHKETTVFPGDFSDAIASVHAAINHTSANKKFTITFSALYSNENNRLPGTDLTASSRLFPTIQLYDSLGDINWKSQGITFYQLGIENPLFALERKYFTQNDNLSSHIQIGYQLLKGLSFRASFGYNVFRTDERTMIPSGSIDPALNANNANSVMPSAEFANSSMKSWIVEPQLEYRRVGKLGGVTMLLGGTFQDKTNSSASMSGTNYTSDLLLGSINGAGIVYASDDYSRYRYSAVFGRINYNYQNRYLLNLTARRDGSSRFAPENQWANFGAIGAAWLFSNETFVRDLLPFLSYGKLRGSYGTSGNDQIGDYKYLNLWQNTIYTYDGVIGLIPTSLYNPKYNWEISKKAELALELGFLKDRIIISTAFYRNRSSNQLVFYLLPIQTGFNTVIRNFPGLVENKGWEFTVATENIHSQFWSWSTAFNISIPRNRLISFPGLAQSNYKTRYEEGKSLTITRGYHFTGMDSQIGLYTFLDVDGNGSYSSAADYVFGPDLDPKFYGGIQNNLSFKQFDLGFFWDLKKQRGIGYLAGNVNSPGTLQNQPIIVLERWQQPGDITDIQRYSTKSLTTPSGLAASKSFGAYSVSDGKYQDILFARLRNLSFSYRFPGTVLDRRKIQEARIYIQAQNLWTVTNYKGSDPEVQNSNRLPILKTIVAGLQLTF